jgi:hypothetical protein
VIICDIFEQTGLGLASSKAMFLINSSHNRKIKKVVTLISNLLSVSQRVSTGSGFHHDAAVQTHIVKMLI